MNCSELDAALATGAPLEREVEAFVVVGALGGLGALLLVWGETLLRPLSAAGGAAALGVAAYAAWPGPCAARLGAAAAGAAVGAPLVLCVLSKGVVLVTAAATALTLQPVFMRPSAAPYQTLKVAWKRDYTECGGGRAVPADSSGSVPDARANGTAAQPSAVSC